MSNVTVRNVEATYLRPRILASVTRDPTILTRVPALVYNGATGYIPRALLRIPTLRTFHLEENNFRGDQKLIGVLVKGRRLLG